MRARCYLLAIVIMLAVAEVALAQEKLKLEAGQLLMVPVQAVERVAVANPDVVDVKVVSANEVLLQAKKIGTTNLLVWDRRGQVPYQIAVIDLTSEQTAIEAERIISGLKPESVNVRRDGTRIVLTGTVDSDEALDNLDKLVEPFPNVTSLVTVVPSVVKAPSLIELGVQLVEMSRDAQDTIGVDWSNAATFTETPFEGQAEEPLGGRIAEAFRIGSWSRRSSGSSAGLTATLNFLVQNGKARVLAEPKLVTTEGKQATSFIGAQIPIITSTSVSAGTVTQSVEFKDVGVRLTMTPTLIEGGERILTNVKAEVSRVSSATGLGGAISVGTVNVPAFTIRQAQSDVSSRSGETIFIAGLLSSDEKKTISQLPALGSVPVLGNLFRSTDFVEGRTELVITVTPILLSKPPKSKDDRVAEMERSLALSQPVAPADDPMMHYALTVQQQLATQARYPYDARMAQGTVKLRLGLLRQGVLTTAAIEQSSGDAAFDRAALELLKRQPSFPPFPQDVIASELVLTVPVVFSAEQ